jgi:hypothetical protein
MKFAMLGFAVTIYLRCSSITTQGRIECIRDSGATFFDIMRKGLLTLYTRTTSDTIIKVVSVGVIIILGDIVGLLTAMLMVLQGMLIPKRFTSGAHTNIHFCTLQCNCGRLVTATVRGLATVMQNVSIIHTLALVGVLGHFSAATISWIHQLMLYFQCGAGRNTAACITIHFCSTATMPTVGDMVAFMHTGFKCTFFQLGFICSVAK